MEKAAELNKTLELAEQLQKQLKDAEAAGDTEKCIAIDQQMDELLQQLVAKALAATEEMVAAANETSAKIDDFIEEMRVRAAEQELKKGAIIN